MADSTHIRISGATRARLQAQRAALVRAYERHQLRAPLDCADGLSDDALVAYLLDQAEAHQRRARAAGHRRRKGGIEILSAEDLALLADIVNTAD